MSSLLQKTVIAFLAMACSLATSWSQTPTPTAACSDDTWTATNVSAAPAPRSSFSAVWTGSEMIVWGGQNSGNMYLNTGARYNPTTDTWTATNTTNAPTARFSHTAIWTGSEMIVWGGAAGAGNGYYVNTGGRYNPATDSWTATSITNAPAGKVLHTAVWTGSEMIVWAGLTISTGFSDTGGRYDPSTDSWTATTTDNVPHARYRHTAVWTGSEMIVWAGYAGTLANTGARYNPAKDSWTATSPNNAPIARERHAAVWTGWEMIVWGGDNGSSLNTGGKYNPFTDSWGATSTDNAPTARYLHTAVSVGSEMMVWGGYDGASYLDTGARYSPSTDGWAPTSTTNAPTGRAYYAPVWTGSEVIVWGGNNGISSLNTGVRYCAHTSEVPTPTPITPTPAPTASPAPPCTYRVLIVYADSAPPAQLQAALLAEPGIVSADLFEAVDATPTLGQLQNYDIVVPIRNNYSGGFAGTTTIGNNLANYVDGGGLVVQVGLSFLGPYPQGGINGRWLSGGYSPYAYNNSYALLTTNTLGTFIPGHPLMEGVTSLQSNFHNIVTLAAGAVQVAAWNNEGDSLVAYQTVGGQITVGVTAYIGCHATWGGAFPRIIANAGRWLKPGGCPIPTPTPIPTPLPTTTPTPTPPPTVIISGTVSYCSNPVPGPVPNVTLTLTDGSSGSTITDSSGNYTFSSLAAGGSYTVTPTKSALSPGSAGVSTVDVIGVQRQFLNLGTPLSGCRLTAADVNGDTSINTVDVIAIQRFFLGLSTGIANVGKYQFSPVSRSYSPLNSNQTGQNYDALVFGDVASPFAE